MNEALIKNIIKYKLTTSEKRLDQLPSEMSSNIKNLGRIILSCINESCQEINNHCSHTENRADKLNNIKID